MDTLQGQFWTLGAPRLAWGLRRVQQVKGPAAGQDWSWVPPAGFIHRPISIRAVLKTNAEVGERFPTLQVADGDQKVLLESPLETFASASEELQVTWHSGFSITTKVANHKLGIWLPDVILDQGYSIKVTTTGLKATDQWGNIQVWYEEFELNPRHETQLLHALHDQYERVERILNGHAI